MRIGSTITSHKELVAEQVFGDIIIIRREHMPPGHVGPLRVTFRKSQPQTIDVNVSISVNRALAAEIAYKLMEFARTGELKADRTESGAPRKYYCGSAHIAEQPGFAAEETSKVITVATEITHNENRGRILDAQSKPFDNRVPVRLRG